MKNPLAISLSLLLWPQGCIVSIVVARCPSLEMWTLFRWDCSNICSKPNKSACYWEKYMDADYTILQTAREKALKGASATTPTSSSRRKTPASRMVHHYLQVANDPQAGPMNSPNLSRVTLSQDMQSRLGPSPAVAAGKITLLVMLSDS